MSTVNTSPWKQSIDLPLPSGAIVKVRKRSLQTLIMAGIMPLELVNKVQQAGAKEAKENPEIAATLKEYLTLIIENCVLEPRIIMSGTPGPGEESIADVPPDDIKAIMAYFNTGRPEPEARQLASFRTERPGADAGGDVPEVQAAAIRGNGAAA